MDAVLFHSRHGHYLGLKRVLEEVVDPKLLHIYDQESESIVPAEIAWVCLARILLAKARINMSCAVLLVDDWRDCEDRIL